MIDGMLYWLIFQDNREITIGRYDGDAKKLILLSDDVWRDLEEVKILDEVEFVIPEYARWHGYENKI